MKKKLFRHAKKFLPFLGIILFIFYLILKLDFQEIKEAFLKIHPFFIIFSLSLSIPRVLIRNYAWQVILKEQKIDISFWKSLKVFLIGYFYGSFTPGYYGQLMRIPYLKEKTIEPYGKLFVNTIIELLIRGISIYFIIIVGAIIFLLQFNNVLIIIFLSLGFYLFIILFFIKKERGEKVFLTLIKYLIPKKLKKDFKRFASTFYKDFPRLNILILPIFISIITWILIFTQEYIFVIALGLPISYWAFILLFPIANVAGFIPLTFAGIGIREITAIAIFTTLFSVTKEEILVVSLIGFLATDVFTGFIGFLLSLTETVKKDII